MTADELRQLDRDIAEKVMGHTLCVCPKVKTTGPDAEFEDEITERLSCHIFYGTCFTCKALRSIRCYSTNMADSWLVVERMRDLGYERFDLRSSPNWEAPGRAGFEATFGVDGLEIFGTTAPVAICWAALGTLRPKDPGA